MWEHRQGEMASGQGFGQSEKASWKKSSCTWEIPQGGRSRGLQPEAMVWHPQRLEARKLGEVRGQRWQRQGRNGLCGQRSHRHLLNISVPGTEWGPGGGWCAGQSYPCWAHRKTGHIAHSSFIYCGNEGGGVKWGDV